MMLGVLLWGVGPLAGCRIEIFSTLITVGGEREDSELQKTKRGFRWLRSRSQESMDCERPPSCCWIPSLGIHVHRYIQTDTYTDTYTYTYTYTYVYTHVHTYTHIPMPIPSHTSQAHTRLHRLNHTFSSLAHLHSRKER